MMQTSKQRIIVSDFDGTLTTTDSMFSILRYHRGIVWLAVTLLLMLPQLILMKLGLYSNQRTKEFLLRRAFGSISRTEFHNLCQRFASANGHILRQSLFHKLQQEQECGTTVIVITASPEEWVSALVPMFRVVGTQMQYTTDDRYAGHFLTPNCYGPEKVARLLQAVPDLATHRDNYHVTAYGDSRGDRELLEFADEGIWVKTPLSPPSRGK